MRSTKYSSSATRSITTSYQSWTLTNAPMVGKNSLFGCVELDTLYVYINTISGPTALTMKISRDSAGDELIVPEFTTGTSPIPALYVGETTATDGTAIVAIGSMLPVMSSSDIGTMYLWIKADSGTATGAECHLACKLLN